MEVVFNWKYRHIISLKDNSLRQSHQEKKQASEHQGIFSYSLCLNITALVLQNSVPAWELIISKQGASFYNKPYKTHLEKQTHIKQNQTKTNKASQRTTTHQAAQGSARTDHCFPTLDSSSLPCPSPRESCPVPRVLSRRRPCPVTCAGTGPQPVPEFLRPAEAQEGAAVPRMPGADVSAEKQSSLFFVQPSSPVPSPAFSKGTSEPSAQPGWKQTLPSLISEGHDSIP